MAYRPGRSFQNLAAAAEVTVLSGIANKKIRVVGGLISAHGGANNLTFKSGTGGATNMVLNLAANQVLPLPLEEEWAGWWDVAVGLDLTVTPSAATGVIIRLIVTYVD